MPGRQPPSTRQAPGGSDAPAPKRRRGSPLGERRQACLSARRGVGQGDRIFIPCIDLDWRLEGDLITGLLVVDACSTLLLWLEISDAITLPRQSIECTR